MSKSLTLFVSLISFVNSHALFAGGFQVNLQGQKQTGMGHTGTGLITDASNSFFNPGGFAFVEKSSISLGACFILSSTAYLEQYPGIYTTNTESSVSTPFTFYTAFRHAQLLGEPDTNGYRQKKEARWNLGFGAYTPFGSGIKYQDDWLGQFVIREMSLKTIFLQTTFGFKVSDKLGVGLAYIYGFGDFTLRKAVPAAGLNNEYGEGILTGKASGHGFNAGLFYQLTNKVSLGLSYRSSVTVKEDAGTADFSVPSSLEEFFPSTEFSTSIKLPQTANFGVGYQANKKTTLAFDINFVGWSSYDSLVFDFKENTDKLEDIHSPRMYKDVFIFRVGAEYRANDIYTVRAGGYYDMDPGQDGFITPETPGSKKIGFTAGASFHVSDHFNIDLSLVYIEGWKRTDINLETGFGGTWKSKAIIPGFALEYIF